MRGRTAIVAWTLVIAGTTAPAQEPKPGKVAKEALRAGGPHCHLVLYPVQLQKRPNENVGTALGLVLESLGMDNLEMAGQNFDPAGEVDWEKLPEQFAAHVKAHPPAEGFALYAEYLGEPQTGPQEVRFVVVDKEGRVALADRQTPKDADFKRTAAKDPDPMGCSVLVGERLFSEAGWDKGSAPREPKGKFAKLWAEKSGMPTETEREQMQARAAKLKGQVKAAKFSVYATQVNGTSDGASAAHLAADVQKRLGATATVVAEPLEIEIQPTPNEQKRLWDLARAFRAHLRAHPAEADYALIAEYIIRDSGPAHSVHWVLCDRAGEWVAVDFQNNQHGDFQRVDPRSVADCDRLALDRIAKHLK